MNQEQELQNLIRADTIGKGIKDVTGIVNDAKNLKDSFKGFGKLQNLDQQGDLDLQNLITWKQARGHATKWGKGYLKSKLGGLFQNLDQQNDLDLQNLITWKQAGGLAGKAGKAYAGKALGGIFQNLD